MNPTRDLLPLIVLLAVASVAGCAATPEDRWYQQREALTTANEVYLANLPLMNDEQIVFHGELLQAARAGLDQARAHLPEGGSSFDAALDAVEAILIRLAEQSAHTSLTETIPDESH